MATEADLERVMRNVLNEGTAFGQLNWAGTSQATLHTLQQVYNLLVQQVIPKLPSTGQPGNAQTATNDASLDTGVQRLKQGGTDAERLTIENTLLVETDNGSRGGEEEASQTQGATDDNG